MWTPIWVWLGPEDLESAKLRWNVLVSRSFFKKIFYFIKIWSLNATKSINAQPELIYLRKEGFVSLE